MSRHIVQPSGGSDIERIATVEAALRALEVLSQERDLRYEERAKGQDDRTALALTSAEKAISKAETATEKRFDAVNEFRGTLNDYQATLITKAEVYARFSNYDEKLETIQKDIGLLRESRSELGGARTQSQETRAQLNVTTGQAIVVLGIIVGIVEFIVRTAPK